jgi:hypothetical protein
MAEGAQVKSVEVLESFRSSLILYLSKARPALDDVGSGVVRMRLWVQEDRRRHWEGEIRRRQRALEQAQQELFSARLSNLREVTLTQQKAVQRAQRALGEAEDRLGRVRHWGREFENRTSPFLKHLEQLSTFLSHDMSRATASLTEAIRALENYLERGPRPADAGPGTEQGTESVESSTASDGSGAAAAGASAPPQEGSA